MSPVAKRGLPTSALSTLSWRCSPASRRTADTHGAPGFAAVYAARSCCRQAIGALPNQ
jgi:hypothetical protein